MMKRIFLLATILLVVVAFSGCKDGQTLPGVDAPQFKPLLDLAYWMDKGCEGGCEEFLPDEWAGTYDAAMDALGCRKYDQTGLEASIDDGTVYVMSEMKYTGALDDDTLCAALMDWQPVKADIIRKFTTDKTLALYSMGNPKGMTDAMVNWVGTSDALTSVIHNISGEDEYFAETELGIGVGRMAALGVWLRTQEEYYHYFGDEVAIALLENPDFAGFDPMYSANNHLEWIPFRPLIAFDMADPGFAGELNEIFKYYSGILTEMSDYGGNPDEFMKFEEKRIEDEKVFIINFDDNEFKLAWVEKDGVLFISDLDTIENLGDYYDPENEIDYPEFEYNDYLYLNAEKTATVFYPLIDDAMTNDFGYILEDEDGQGLDVISKVLGTLSEPQNLGELRLVSQINTNSIDYLMVADEPLADLLMVAMDFAKKMIDVYYSPVPYENSIGMYHKFYGGDNKEPGPEVKRVPQ